MYMEKNFLILIIMLLFLNISYSQNKYSRIIEGPKFKARSLDETLSVAMMAKELDEQRLKEASYENSRVILVMKNEILRRIPNIKSDYFLNQLNKKYDELSILEMKNIAYIGDDLNRIYSELINIFEFYNEWESKDKLKRENELKISKSKQFITTIDPIVDKMEIYSEPNMNSKVIYVAKKDAIVKVIDNTRDVMFKVEVNGYSGYVSKHYLKDNW